MTDISLNFISLASSFLAALAFALTYSMVGAALLAILLAIFALISTDFFSLI